MAAPRPGRSANLPYTARDGGPKEAAAFIAEHLIGLARLARHHKLDMLGFLLDMALMEAKEIVGAAAGARKAGRRGESASSPLPRATAFTEVIPQENRCDSGLRCDSGGFGMSFETFELRSGRIGSSIELYGRGPR